MLQIQNAPSLLLPANTFTSGVNQGHLSRHPLSYLTNYGHRAGDGLLYLVNNLVGCGKKQFIVLAASQSELSTVRLETRLNHRVDWHQLLFYSGADLACFAYVS